MAADCFFHIDYIGNVRSVEGGARHEEVRKTCFERRIRSVRRFYSLRIRKSGRRDGILNDSK